MTPKRLSDTDRLFGYTTVRSLEFKFDQVRFVCDVTLHLESPTTSKGLSLLLKEVSGLRLKEFGGGLTQLLFLVIEDVSEAQLDRINFHVKETERGTFECDCRHFEVIE